ncbi:MAG: PepSY domain-containing protein [Bacteroidota bacterium]
MTGLYFLFFVILITLTGLLLAWKKNTDLLSIPTHQGSTENLSAWIPLHELKEIGLNYYYRQFGSKEDVKIERMDIRPEKGSLKIRYERSYYEVQLDGGTGEILHSGYRIADIIENIHDGSIIDRLLGSQMEVGKLLYSTFLGLATMIYALSGFLLWYERRKIRKMISK